MLSRPEREASAGAASDNADTSISPVSGLSGRCPCYLAPNNRYLSFLLSRYRPDPYVRVQYPGIFGPDPKAEWFGQHKHQPWYVAPLLKMGQSTNETRNSGTSGRECVAYLTLDEGFYRHLGPEHWRKREEGEAKVPDKRFEDLRMSRDHSLQNEMMHAMDFFVVCLATSVPFQALVKEVRKTLTDVQHVDVDAA